MASPFRMRSPTPRGLLAMRRGRECPSKLTGSRLAQIDQAKVSAAFASDQSSSLAVSRQQPADGTIRHLPNLDSPATTGLEMDALGTPPPAHHPREYPATAPREHP